MTFAFLFPGQGSQAPGMGLDLHEKHALARDRFQQAGELTGLDLSGLCFGTDAARLRATEHAQPAMFLIGF
jgi:[acyl-carrier-protein] S-malonyltransferase